VVLSVPLVLDLLTYVEQIYEQDWAHWLLKNSLGRSTASISRTRRDRASLRNSMMLGARFRTPIYRQFVVPRAGLEDSAFVG